MNTQPEQLLRQLRVLQLQKKEIDTQITEKKMVLEKYYQESICLLYTSPSPRDRG